MIVLRKFSPTDIQGVMQVVRGSLGEVYPPSLYLTIHNLWGDGFTVAVEDGRIVGFVAAVIPTPKTVRVLMLAVLPEHRRRSLGLRLMAELYQCCLANGLDTITLEVRKSNMHAIAFYEHQGFSACGEIKCFYTNGEDALMMVKVLQS